MFTKISLLLGELALLPAFRQLGNGTTEADSGRAAGCESAWQEHLEAVRLRNATRAQQAYLADSLLLFRSSAAKGLQAFDRGALPSLFDSLFEALGDARPEVLRSDVRADIDLGNGSKACRVLHVWQRPDRGLHTVVESLTFVGSGVARHHIAVDCRGPGRSACAAAFPGAVRGAAPVPLQVTPEVKRGVNQHALAFAERRAAPMAKTYPPGSSVLMYDIDRGALNSSHGGAGIASTFKQFWSYMPSGGPRALESNVAGQWCFVNFEQPRDGIRFGTDTFIFDAKGRILDQTIVFRRSS